MAFANSVILYNCKLNHNGLFVCDFGGSGSARDSIMGGSNNLATYKFGYSSCTYMRKDKVIVVDENADVLDAAGVNYCRYINGDFNNSMYFYAFVDSIEYVAPRTSRLHIRTDCFTTYFSRIQPNQCFVEREHVANDGPFDNTIPENVGSGELIRCYSTRLLGNYLDSHDKTNWIAAFNVATDPDQLALGSYLGVVSVGGIPSGTQWYGVDPDNVVLFTKYLVDHEATILSISLISVFSSWINDGEDITVRGNDVHVYNLRDITPAEDGYRGDIRIDVGFAESSWSGSPGQITYLDVFINDYISQMDSLFNNRKMLCYPYTAFELFTYDGSSITLVPQGNIIRYPSGSYGFEMKDTMVQGSAPSETTIVAVYTGTSAEILPVATQSFSGFPTISVTQDSYAQFVARNANSLKFQKDVALRDGTFKLAQSIIGVGKTGMDANASGFVDAFQGAISAGDTIDAIDAKMADQKMAPDGITGHSSDGALFHLNRLGVWFGVKRVNPDLFASIDSYFDRYGYAIKVHKTPQWDSRSQFNFVKTAGANIGGQIPESDKETINQLLDTGLTVWHSVDAYGTYDGRANRAGVR